MKSCDIFIVQGGISRLGNKASFLFTNVRSCRSRLMQDVLTERAKPCLRVRAAICLGSSYCCLRWHEWPVSRFQHIPDISDLQRVAVDTKITMWREGRSHSNLRGLSTHSQYLYHSANPIHGNSCLNTAGLLWRSLNVSGTFSLGFRTPWSGANSSPLVLVTLGKRKKTVVEEWVYPATSSGIIEREML